MLLRVMYLVSIKIDLFSGDLNYIQLAVSKYIHYKKIVKNEISFNNARFCDTKKKYSLFI